MMEHAGYGMVDIPSLVLVFTSQSLQMLLLVRWCTVLFCNLCQHLVILGLHNATCAGASSLPPPSMSSSTGLPSHQILCCAYNANGTVFVTGSSDTYARV